MMASSHPLACACASACAMRGIPPTVSRGFGTSVAPLRRVPPPAARITVWVTDCTMRSVYQCGAERCVHVTFRGLAKISDPERGAAPRGAEAGPTLDRFEHETIEILKRLSRRPIDPSPQS